MSKDEYPQKKSKATLRHEIEQKYDLKFPHILTAFHGSITDFYKKAGFLTEKQVAALKKPQYTKFNGSDNSDDREDDSLQAMAYDWGSQ